jgi:hypothetical protein
VGVRVDRSLNRHVVSLDWLHHDLSERGGGVEQGARLAYLASICRYPSG